jgi:hexosaminidase
MPLPAQMRLAEPAEALGIETSFTVTASGSGASDPRVQAAMIRMLRGITRQTGLLVAERPAPGTAAATLKIILAAQDHPAPQRLGDNEHYVLNVAAGQATLTADAPLGALRGLNTFLQLIHLSNAGFVVPAVSIDDSPRFPWRGLSLDCSRHFIPLAAIRRTLDGMALVKLNVFHWHLSDDQGFRVESKRFPRLQDMGSDGLYYRQSEIRELIEYAYSLGIRVVPEFDMPGHTTSWFAGYPELASAPGPYSIERKFGIFKPAMNPANEETYEFLDGFLEEMTALFPDEYFHVGGDEVEPDQWKANPSIQAFMKEHGIETEPLLQAYFSKRVQQLVARYGKHMVGWDEALQPGIPTTILIQSWRGPQALAEAARKGYEGILSAGYYLDLMQPASEHYLVSPIQGETAALPVEEQKRILGGEAAMWEELATSGNLDAKLWPRLAAIAERLWSPASAQDTTSMYERLSVTSRWLEFHGLRHRQCLRMMLERLDAGDALAAGHPDRSLEVLERFAEVLEPIKGYTRNENGEMYTQSTALNRLVDSIPPESDAARDFRTLVEHCLQNSSNGALASQDLTRLEAELQAWQANLREVRPLFVRNALMAECNIVADRLETILEMGVEAIDALRSGARWDASSTNARLARLDQAYAPQSEMLIQIQPGVRRLITAAGAVLVR